MKKIFKYPIELNSKKDGVLCSKFDAPRGARVITVSNQLGSTYAWAEVETDNEPVEHQLLVFRTGFGTLPDTPLRFIGTVFDRQFVWHVYAKE